MTLYGPLKPYFLLPVISACAYVYDVGVNQENMGLLKEVEAHQRSLDSRGHKIWCARQDAVRLQAHIENRLCDISTNTWLVLSATNNSIQIGGNLKKEKKKNNNVCHQLLSNNQRRSRRRASSLSILRCSSNPSSVETEKPQI